jgi:hypothetical protein
MGLPNSCRLSGTSGFSGSSFSAGANAETASLDAAEDASAAAAAAAAQVDAQLSEAQRTALSAVAAELIASLAATLRLRDGATRIGRTKVFVRDAAFHTLEGARNAFYAKAAARIQAWAARHRFLFEKNQCIFNHPFMFHQLRR